MFQAFRIEKVKKVPGVSNKLKSSQITFPFQDQRMKGLSQPAKVRPRFDGDRVYIHDSIVLTVIGGNTQVARIATIRDLQFS